MDNLFLIFGYGIPTDILKDENYNFYLKSVFNKIYDITLKNKATKPLIICCGGKTDTVKPYTRNEADEIIKFFDKFIKQKSFLNSITKNWLFISEKKSLSALENIIESKKIIERRKIKEVNIFIFCEQTREKQIKILATKIFDKNYNFKIIPIDFDVSANRYLSPDFIAKKERANLENSLWALKNPKNLKKYHAALVEKIEYLRKAGPKIHAEAVKTWWEQKFKELKK